MMSSSFFIAAMIAHTNEFKSPNLFFIHLLMDICLCFQSSAITNNMVTNNPAHISFCMCAKYICGIIWEFLSQRMLIILKYTVKLFLTGQQCVKTCFLIVPPSWVLLNLGVNFSFLDPSSFPPAYHIKVSKTFSYARHRMQARHPVWARGNTFSGASFAPLTLSRPGNYADISLTKKAQLVREVITRPHFLTWQSVTQTAHFPYFSYCYLFFLDQIQVRLVCFLLILMHPDIPILSYRMASDHHLLHRNIR